MLFFLLPFSLMTLIIYYYTNFPVMSGIFNFNCFHSPRWVLLYSTWHSNVAWGKKSKILSSAVRTSERKHFSVVGQRSNLIIKFVRKAMKTRSRRRVLLIYTTSPTQLRSPLLHNHYVISENWKNIENMIIFSGFSHLLMYESLTAWRYVDEANNKKIQIHIIISTAARQRITKGNC